MEKVKNEYVEIFNNSTGSVSLISDKSRVNFPAPSRRVPKVSKKIKIDEIVDIYNTAGVASVFEQEILIIKDAEIRELLGMEPLGEFTKTYEELQSFLIDSSPKELESFILYCSNQALDNLFELAKTLPNKDLQKNEILRGYTGKDAYKMYQELEEEKQILNPAEPRKAVSRQVEVDKDEDSKPSRKRVN